MGSLVCATVRWVRHDGGQKRKLVYVSGNGRICRDDRILWSTSAWKTVTMQAMSQVSNFVGTENIGLAAGGTHAALDGIDWLSQQAGSGSFGSLSGYMCLRLGLC